MASERQGQRKHPPAKCKRARGDAQSTGDGITSARAIADQLEKDIANGRFSDTGKLPPEHRLASQFGASRYALRSALSELVRRGVLRNVPYVGTYLAPRRVEFTLGAKTRVVEALAGAGIQPGRLLLSRRRCQPPENVARLLGVARRTEVIELSHILTGNGRPIGYARTWMPADRFARIVELFDVEHGLRRAFAQIGVTGARRKYVRITSRPASSSERKWLDLSAGAVLIGLHGVSTDAADEPTHAFDYHFNADRMAFVIDL
jgi:GntR family phosphonate transport system transcriptional regulator